MGGHAQKKVEKQYQSARKAYTASLVVANLLHLVTRFGWYGDADLVSLCEYCLLGGLGGFLVKFILQMAKQGVDYTYYQDAFILTLVVQVGSLVSPLFWLTFLLIPLYIGGKIWSFLKN